jgi:hypothetical protein
MDGDAQARRDLAQAVDQWIRKRQGDQYVQGCVGAVHGQNPSRSQPEIARLFAYPFK